MNTPPEHFSTSFAKLSSLPPRGFVPSASPDWPQSSRRAASSSMFRSQSAHCRTAVLHERPLPALPPRCYRGCFGAIGKIVCLGSECPLRAVFSNKHRLGFRFALHLLLCDRVRMCELTGQFTRVVATRVGYLGCYCKHFLLAPRR